MSAVSNTYGPQQWADVNGLGAEETPVKTAGTGEDALASKDVFLQLLVAQMKNQNPLDPADGVEFVTQLAQFTQLEQSLSMSQDLSAIREVLAPDASASDSGEDTEQP
ncbi:flagellar hook capping FlgD N-terminal domain-containing protein [uncultured Paludibaculum sp.]|uniref:flagellar hook assembly protein FlgD n=1 Tax=uncultured Paludibaculum sp. TaxID=1765020 RepID=UPI002AAB79E4|nr:flagellar hook capping FlgD N-terminal domain-containing protein [uncultured Paludibaculum sp.]